MEDTMVDLETMSTSSNACIVAIGACKFDKEFGIMDKFYVTVDLKSSVKKGFDVDADTIKWWLKQSDAARKEISFAKTDIKDALKQFQDWLGKGNCRIWGNGAGFDNVILTNAFKRFGVEQPWNYGLNRCFRTLKGSYPKIELADEGVAHNALDDAVYQAKYLIKLVEKYKLPVLS